MPVKPLEQKGKKMKLSFRLSDADREKYGGDEWVHLDTDRLADLGYDRLDELERDIRRDDDTSIARILALEWPRTSMLGYRGMAWLARQASGLDKPAWRGFKPDVMNATFRVNVGDADPPASGSSEPPSAKTALAKKPPSKKA